MTQTPPTEPTTRSRVRWSGPLVATAFLAAAVCLAAGVALGAWLRSGEGDATPFQIPASVLPALEVDATATQAHDNFVIATGFVDDGIEGLYFLDFLTGELRGVVLNQRGPGFGCYYSRNIMQDFGQQAVKNPKYLMVTGRINSTQRGSATSSGRLARTAIYVVEANSGQVVAYGLRFNPSIMAAGKEQGGSFIPLARETLREATIRDQ
ncbi:MAG: hypothetical protein AAF805_11080 [Planctomycetota bacterium]